MSEVSSDGWVVEDFVDGSGCPFGFEDDGVFEDGIALEVQAYAEVVEVAAEEEGIFFVFDAVLLADLEVVILGDVVITVVFEGGADSDPEFGEGLSDVGQAGDVVGNSFFNLV